MKLDTSSYYPKSPLDDDEELREEPERPEIPEEPEKPGEPARPDKLEIREEPGISDDSDDSGIVSAVATAISWLLVPMLMPVYGMLLIFGLTVLNFVIPAAKVTFTLTVAGVNVLLPAVMVLLLKRMGVVEDLGLNNRRERTVPYLVSVLCFAGTAWFLWARMFPMWVVMFYAAGAVAGMVQMIVNLWWKISAHAAGIAGIVALMLRISHEPFVMPGAFTWLLIAIGCAGLVGSARLWLGRHTLAQVMAGYAVGFCSVYFMTMTA